MIGNGCSHDDALRLTHSGDEFGLPNVKLRGGSYHFPRKVMLASAAATRSLLAHIGIGKLALTPPTRRCFSGVRVRLDVADRSGVCGTPVGPEPGGVRLRVGIQEVGNEVGTVRAKDSAG
jgi:hypothetical protein